jgi:MFS superfamily sulfate permease-like transporter
MTGPPGGGDNQVAGAGNRVGPAFRELSGSLGDYGTIIPLLCAVSIISNISATWVFIFAGLATIATGIYYRFPIAVEPLKVIAVIAIAGNLSGAEIAASGILIGLVFIVLSCSGFLPVISRYIPEEVIRGVQLAIALLLAVSAVGFARGNLLPFLAGLGVIGLFWLLRKGKNVPDLSALVLLGVAGMASAATLGLPPLSLPGVPGLVVPSAQDFSRVIVLAVIPQVIVTLTNSVLATGQLATDLGKPVPTEKLSRSIGVMNLVLSPFGGFPVCHGAGGLAAQYRFGARTGMAGVLGGTVLVIFGLLLGSAVQSYFPPGIFGAMLVVVSIEMALHSIKTRSMPVTTITGVVGAFVSMTAGFFLGLAVAWGLRRYKRGR